MTLRHGARQALDLLDTDITYLKTDLAELKEMLKKFRGELRFNPAGVEALAERCIKRIDEKMEPRIDNDIKPRIKDDIEPRMQRTESTIAQQITDLQERLERVEKQRIIVVKEPE